MNIYPECCCQRKWVVIQIRNHHGIFVNVNLANFSSFCSILYLHHFLNRNIIDRWIILYLFNIYSFGNWNKFDRDVRDDVGKNEIMTHIFTHEREKIQRAYKYRVYFVIVSELWASLSKMMSYVFVSNTNSFIFKDCCESIVLMKVRLSRTLKKNLFWTYKRTKEVSFTNIIGNFLSHTFGMSQVESSRVSSQSNIVNINYFWKVKIQLYTVNLQHLIPTILLIFLKNILTSTYTPNDLAYLHDNSEWPLQLNICWKFGR